ncbi:MAG TPA: phage holin family protein [Chthonomonadales bacterium]|nr:phage holin family protein [Chthonomonadales bacterium]
MLRNWLLRWVASALALAIVANIPGLGISYGGDLVVLLKATLVIGLSNSLIRPILSTLAMPLNCMTFGLAAIAINSLLFMFVGVIVVGFKVTTPQGVLLGPVLMGLIGGLLSHLLTDSGRRGK